MGCNFYLLRGEHVGKRSVAGSYCWDCKKTLCKGGKEAVHKSSSYWYEACPFCGQFPAEEPLSDSSAGRELGFNKKPFRKKKGVKSCSSFTWGIKSERLKRVKKVKDEYGKEYSINEFRKVLEECPIQSFELVGKDFS